MRNYKIISEGQDRVTVEISKSFLKRMMQWEESLQVAKAIRRSLRERNKYPELSREEAEKEIEKCFR
ncbi:hypothetical protein AAE250_07365 [Bacteroides sp. GD17]|jgi:hypothetical protein|uniref:hypothetical protein n=1 Tax=Bacteroides sp. GD17 TaxID=3139826 RepID=UPI0025D83CCC|nr:hypothetical protein [uncultured Bacteroides sp.]